MKRVKIVQKFFSKFEANCETAYQRSKAKKEGVMGAWLGHCPLHERRIDKIR